ncbi:MAG: rubredoxin [Proteobacteria bacterium]|nr:rubredoxin [Pseudomonadota bacterium]
MRKWMCLICGFVYDEAKGMPSQGVPAGTSWANVPESWVCSDCGQKKSGFKMRPIDS